MGLDLRLTAIEGTGNGRILTNPKMLTLNNEEAKISQGLQIPYLVINQYGLGSAAFKSVTVEIKVTPHITADNTVSMDVDISKS
ncbi:Type II and III secretion system domain protein, partial [Candidatus Magnetoovum chiemensis]